MLYQHLGHHVIEVWSMIMRCMFATIQAFVDSVMTLVSGITAVLLLTETPSPLLDNMRVMVIVCRLRGNIIRTALCWIVRHYVHNQ